MSGAFLEEDNWQRTLDIDLTAALLGVRLAANAMQRSNSSGEICRCSSSAATRRQQVLPACCWGLTVSRVTLCMLCLCGCSAMRF